MHNRIEVNPALFFKLFFSSSETAYFNLRQHRGNFSTKVEGIINNPEKLLVTILTGNTLVNVAIASLAALIIIGVENPNVKHLLISLMDGKALVSTF